MKFIDLAFGTALHLLKCYLAYEYVYFLIINSFSVLQHNSKTCLAFHQTLSIQNSYIPLGTKLFKQRSCKPGV